MDGILDRFIAACPATVMVQAVLRRALADTTLDDLFEANAAGQYTRDLTFSCLTRLMIPVVFGTYGSVHAAFRKLEYEIPVSITSVYNKLDGLETGISEALVHDSAKAMSDIIMKLPEASQDPVQGLRVRTLDGNNLAGTDRRLECLRGSGAAALPGMSLVVRDSRTGLLTDVIPCEDAYTGERSLHPQVLALVERDDLWLMDRNFCTNDYMKGIADRDAFFVVRHHTGTKLHELGPETHRKHTPESVITEQQVMAGDVECRCVIIRLKTPLRDGTTVIRILTNVPRKQLSARRAAAMYRTRWKIEAAFQELTDNLRCEIKTLAYPKAALFAFALAVVAYNVLVVTRVAIASGLKTEGVTEAQLSSYHMATEMATHSAGMSIAVPKLEWQRFVTMTAKQFAAWLHKTASELNWRQYRKNPRGPKKPVAMKRTSRGAHRSTFRELAERKKSAPWKG
jgi:Transposase DDE domain